MKRSATAVVATLLVLAAASAAGAADSSAPAADWDQQNKAMGHLVYRLSNINAVNGLNLTREQAVSLRNLARDVEATAPPLNLGGRFRPDLAEVRDVYLEVQRTLLAGADVSEALRQKVSAARRTQSLAARMSLVRTPAAGTGCARCHAEPAAADVRTIAQDVEQAAVAPRWPVREIFLAHQTGLLGPEGLRKVVAAAPQVDRILTTEQKEVVRNFSCCLVPPKELGDPVRAGQADAGEGTVKLLRYVRTVTAERWPATQAALVQKADDWVVLLQPGASDARKREVRQAVADLCERARAMSETEFEMEKGNLARQFTQATRQSRELDDRQQAYMRAMFLLVPGASEAYGRVIERLDGGRKARDDASARASR